MVMAGGAGIVGWLFYDSDFDGMPNVWEQEKAATWSGSVEVWGEKKYELEPKINFRVNDARVDPDNDGLTNLQEFKAGTHPGKYDTDGDWLPDGFEVRTAGLDATRSNDRHADPDGDGMSDHFESRYGFNPRVADGAGDADGDTLTNAVEAAFGSNPCEADIDADSLNDARERGLDTNPWMQDSDGKAGIYPTPNEPGDGLPDDWEVKWGFNPLVRDDPKSDADDDGLGLLAEYEEGTNPWKKDTDGDGSTDGEEVKAHTSPTDPHWGGKPPSAPTDVRMTRNRDGSMTYHWTDTSDNEESFVIWDRLPDGTWQVVGEAPANATSLTVPAPAAPAKQNKGRAKSKSASSRPPAKKP